MQKILDQKLSALANDDITPEEAVRAYHGQLSDAGIKPHRCLVLGNNAWVHERHYPSGTIHGPDNLFNMKIIKRRFKQ